jgi:hypothetical protein
MGNQPSSGAKAPAVGGATRETKAVASTPRTATSAARVTTPAALVSVTDTLTTVLNNLLLHERPLAHKNIGLLFKL